MLLDCRRGEAKVLINIMPNIKSEIINVAIILDKSWRHEMVAVLEAEMRDRVRPPCMAVPERRRRSLPEIEALKWSVEGIGVST
jgi:hypothetical protein